MARTKQTARNGTYKQYLFKKKKYEISKYSLSTACLLLVIALNFITCIHETCRLTLLFYSKNTEKGRMETLASAMSLTLQEYMEQVDNDLPAEPVYIPEEDPHRHTEGTMAYVTLLQKKYKECKYNIAS